MVPDEFRLSGRFWGSSRDVPNREGKLLLLDEKGIREIASMCGRDLDGLEWLPKYVWW